MPEQGNFIKVPNTLWDDENLTLAEKGVLISLLRHFNWERRRAWPSRETISKETRLSEKWVSKTLASLESKKHITIIRSAGRGNYNQYEIHHLSDETEKTGTQSPISDEPDGEKRGTQFQKKGNSVPEKGNSVPEKGNSVLPNKIKNKTKNKTSEQDADARARETRPLFCADPWVEAQLSKIRKVVEAPKPGKLPELLAQWRETYGGATVEKTIDRALRWMLDTSTHYQDMGRFIGRWLARDAESPRATARRTGQSVPDYGDKPKSWRELMPEFFDEGGERQ